MYDFIKVKVNEPDIEHLKKLSELDFTARVSPSTGELVSSLSAMHQDLKFSITEMDNVYMSGSVHKYTNNGLHNADRFTLPDYTQTLSELENKFRFKASSCHIQNLEVGINLTELDIPTSEILNSLILHKGKRFKDIDMKTADYRKVSYQQYDIKAYNKKLQGMTNSECFRWEMKFKCAAQLPSGINTLHDLTKPQFIQTLSGQLIQQWDDVLFYDKDVLKHLCPEEQLKVLQWSNASFWEEMQMAIKSKSIAKNRYYRERGEMESLMNCYSKKKQLIRKAIIKELGRIE